MLLRDHTYFNQTFSKPNKVIFEPIPNQTVMLLNQLTNVQSLNIEHRYNNIYASKHSSIHGWQQMEYSFCVLVDILL